MELTYTKCDLKDCTFRVAHKDLLEDPELISEVTIIDKIYQICRDCRACFDRFIVAKLIGGKDIPEAKQEMTPEEAWQELLKLVNDPNKQKILNQPLQPLGTPQWGGLGGLSIGGTISTGTGSTDTITITDTATSPTYTLVPPTPLHYIEPKITVTGVDELPKKEQAQADQYIKAFKQIIEEEVKAAQAEKAEKPELEDLWGMIAPPPTNETFNV